MWRFVVVGGWARKKGSGLGLTGCAFHRHQGACFTLDFLNFPPLPSTKTSCDLRFGVGGGGAALTAPRRLGAWGNLGGSCR